MHGSALLHDCHSIASTPRQWALTQVRTAPGTSPGAVRATSCRYIRGGRIHSRRARAGAPRKILASYSALRESGRIARACATAYNIRFLSP